MNNTIDLTSADQIDFVNATEKFLRDVFRCAYNEMVKRGMRKGQIKLSDLPFAEAEKIRQARRAEKAREKLLIQKAIAAGLDEDLS